MAESPNRRWLSFIAYLMFIGVGIASFISPLSSISSTVNLVLTYAWSAACGLGGLIGAWGILKRSALMEFYGLPLQWSCTGLFAITLMARGMLQHQWGALVVGMLLFALTAKLVARWWDIARLIRTLERRRDDKQ